MTTGIDRIAAERKRQIQDEGWTADHDAAEWYGGELAKAAACYADWAHNTTGRTPAGWPFDPSWWKPSTDPIRNLEKAGALIAAEIDRLLAVETAKIEAKQAEWIAAALTDPDLSDEIKRRMRDWMRARDIRDAWREKYPEIVALWEKDGVRFTATVPVVDSPVTAETLKPARRVTYAENRLGRWMSAALEDPNVCDAMKADIQAWFDETGAGAEPVEYKTQPGSTASMILTGDNAEGLAQADSVESFAAKWNAAMREKYPNDLAMAGDMTARIVAEGPGPVMDLTGIPAGTVGPGKFRASKEAGYIRSTWVGDAIKRARLQGCQWFRIREGDIGGDLKLIIDGWPENPVLIQSVPIPEPATVAEPTKPNYSASGSRRPTHTADADWYAEKVEEAKAYGCRWVYCHVSGDGCRLLVYAWKERPDGVTGVHRVQD